MVCFSSYWVGTLRRFHTLASLAGLLGVGVCKHTHGELGIAAAAGQHVLLTLPNATLGAQQTAAIMADDMLTTPLPIANGPRWGMPDGAGLGIEIDEVKLAALRRGLSPPRPVPALRRVRRKPCARRSRPTCPARRRRSSGP